MQRTGSHTGHEQCARRGCFVNPVMSDDVIRVSGRCSISHAVRVRDQLIERC